MSTAKRGKPASQTKPATPKKATPKAKAQPQKPKAMAKTPQPRHARPRPAPPKQFGHPPANWRELYFDNLARTGRQLDSMAAAGVKSFATITRARAADPAFVQAEKEAMKAVQAIFEDEMRRRAIEGVQSFTYGPNGEQRSVRTEYSDTLLMRWLERHDATWRPKQEIQHGGAMTFNTRAERKERLAAAEAARAQPLS